ncbi:MAG: phosphoribosylamine--glycine ligase, partial [Spirochaetaceae bacterium]
MVRNGLPTAAASVINNEKELTEYIDAANGKMLVLKKSGLAAGKGVLESSDRETLLDFGQKVLESDSLVAEEYLTGYEVSLFTLGNDSDYLLLPSCADYKKAGDNNTG